MHHKNTHMHRTAKKPLLLCTHRTQFFLRPDVLELCSYTLFTITEDLGRGGCWTVPGYLCVQPCVLMLLLLPS